MISHGLINRLWYESHPLSTLLLPLSWLYCAVIKLRRLAYLSGILPVQKVTVPVIVVGNLTVGGTGKTPLIIWLADYLLAQGHRPGIISRGYGGSNSGKRPQQVRADSNPYLVGDEPVLIAQRTGCPVAVARDRFIAARELLAHRECDVLLCDDGIQHLAFDRDFEIVVIDGDRRFGNGRCLPAGPLREPVSRLATVNMVIGNGKAAKNEHLMEYEYGDLVLLSGAERRSIDSFRGQTLHVVTGIGNPARLHSYLRKHEIRIIKHEFNDHHRYIRTDISFNDEYPIIMTEKDAVKCREFSPDNVWCLPVTPRFGDAFHHRIAISIKEMFNGQKTA